MAKFNYREIARAVATSSVGAKRVNTIYQRKFELHKQQMIEEFDTHPITQEIAGGPGAGNISNTLDGEGNLFSFIGFEEGSNPTAEVRDVLRNETTLTSSARPDVAGEKTVRYKFSLRIPSDSLRSASSMPWESGKSWVESMEKGLSGFSSFLAGKFKESRSGGGIQSKGKVRGGEFRKTKYMTSIFRSFVDKFNRQ